MNKLLKFAGIGAAIIDTACAGAAPVLDVVVDPTTGSYNVSLGGKVWFPGGPTKVWSDGKLFSSDDGSLVVTHADDGAGTDTMGWLTRRYMCHACVCA